MLVCAISGSAYKKPALIEKDGYDHRVTTFFRLYFTIQTSASTDQYTACIHQTTSTDIHRYSYAVMGVPIVVSAKRQSVRGSKSFIQYPLSYLFPPTETLCTASDIYFLSSLPLIINSVILADKFLFVNFSVLFLYFCIDAPYIVFLIPKIHFEFFIFYSLINSIACTLLILPDIRIAKAKVTKAMTAPIATTHNTGICKSAFLIPSE